MIKSESGSGPSAQAGGPGDLLAGWRPRAAWRQLIFMAVATGPTLLAASYLAQMLPDKGANVWETLIIILFAVLWYGLSVGFWLSLMGFWTRLRKRDPWAVSSLLAGGGQAGPWPDGLKVAVLMPICQEDVARVMAGLQAIYESVRASGRLERYEFFILSDSRSPDLWIAEEAAWYELCEELEAHGRIHYRRRRVNLKRKSGNVADFCRRWGRDFELMIVLDADSVMTGASFNQLVAMMLARPQAALIQTVPLGVLKTSPLARIQQFCAGAYGPVFAAGLSWLLLGGGIFWGHNAIIRVKPFMEHCGLPRLKGLAPLGGDIMSHDFVESALLKRAGWEVWLAYDLPGSFEEVPPTLLDELKRDQRWCQGNLQHLKLVTARGLSLSQRLLFINGAFSYLSSFFWLLALLAASGEAIMVALRPPTYFAGPGLFPRWPNWSADWAFALLGLTAVLLFAPKLLALSLIFLKGRARRYGGAARLLAGAFSETLFSALAAPVRMLFHAKVVALTFLGRSVGWRSQNRADSAIGWKEALAFHWTGLLLALIWALVIFRFNRSFFWWLCPIWIPLILAPLVTVWSSRPAWGAFFKRLGLWLIPQETKPPWELARLEELQARPAPSRIPPLPAGAGFVRAVVEPRLNALHVSMLGGCGKRLEKSIHLRRKMLLERTLAHGPDSLNPREKTEILSDPQILRELHRRVWLLTDAAKARWWGLA